MKQIISINDFSSYLFWDIDLSKFDFERNKSQLIYKVVEYGQMEDWKNLLALYGKEEIKTIVLNLRSMDAVTLSFLSNYFEIDKKEFRCYTQSQSKTNFWNS